MKKKGIFLSGSILCLILLVFSHSEIVSESATELINLLNPKIPIINVDFSEIIGKIKPLHGINNGPKSGYTETEDGATGWRLDVTDLYQEMKIPFVRTHDSEYPYGQDRFVDVHCIFPDMARDTEDPSAYNFVYTDQYISAIVESGAEVFYRLGESIEPEEGEPFKNKSCEEKNTLPPEDYAKWAQVCEHIIRHYNKGWADGFYYDIKYWEIWNEPDNRRMWDGDMEAYYSLYRYTARYLKKMHPNIKVGGYAPANFSKENMESFLQSLTIDGKGTPLDFFTWHTYADDLQIFAERAAIVREVLNQYGYEEVPSILDEWNYMENWGDLSSAVEKIQSPSWGAFVAGSLLVMQESPVDCAMYYDGQYAFADIWCGLYDSGGQKQTGYYAFYYFNQLYEMGTQVKTESDTDGLYCCAAAGEKKGILLANCGAGEESEFMFKLKMEGCGKKTAITRISEEYPNGKTEKKWTLFDQMILKMKAGEIIYIEFE